jgi:hypothetical protein
MALPLPKVVADVGPGGPFVTSARGLNALKMDQSAAQYAPYTNYANAASKLAYANMLPYQVQATVMSNPMLWQAFKDKPEALQAMMENFKKSIPQGNNIFGGIDIPKPGSNNSLGIGGIFGALLNKLGIGSSQGNPLSSSSLNNSSGEFGSTNQINPGQIMNNNPQGSSLVPSTQGGINGIIGQQTAKYNKSPYSAGDLIQDPNNPTGTISVPTNETKTAAQNSINATKRVTPQIEKLADLAAPFLSIGGKAQLQWERVKNLLNPDAKHQGKLPAQYAKFNSILQSAPEALVKSYGLRPTDETIKRMQKVIEPYSGETKEQYKTRMLDQLESLRNEQIAVSEENLGGGFELGGNKKINIPTFKNKEEGINWFNNQSEKDKKIIRSQLRNK